jgi:hypothetical protein
MGVEGDGGGLAGRFDDPEAQGDVGNEIAVRRVEAKPSDARYRRSFFRRATWEPPKGEKGR